MQDREQNDMDPAFVDYAWEQMRAQLDEAMPVEDRRRKRGFLLWFFVFLILGGAWVTLRAFGPGEAKESSQPQQEKPIANHQNQVDPATALSSEQEPEPTIFMEEEQAEASPFSEVKAVATAPSTPIPSTPTTTRTAAPKADQPIISSTQKNAFFNPIPDEEVVVTSAGTIETASEVTLTSQEVAATMNEEKREQKYAITTVPTLDLNPEQVVIADKSLGLPGVSKSRPHWFMEGVGGVGLDDAAQLLHLGVGAQLAISPRLALEGGLAYQAYHIGDLSSLSGNQDAEFISFEEVGAGGWNGANYAVTVPFDSAVSSVRAHRLALPLNLRWSPSVQSRWRLSLGGSAAYYLQALVESELPESYGATERLAVTNFDLYNEDQPLFVLDATAEDITSPTSLVAKPLDVARWEWSWTAAVAYRFSGRLEGQVQYRGVLNSWPNTKERLGPNSFAQLSLRYYLQ